MTVKELVSIHWLHTGSADRNSIVDNVELLLCQVLLVNKQANLELLELFIIGFVNAKLRIVYKLLVVAAGSHAHVTLTLFKAFLLFNAWLSR